MAHIRRLFRNDSKLQIIATNMRDGEALGLHPPDFLRDVAKEVRANLRKRFPNGGETATDYIVEFETVCFGELPARPGSPHLRKAAAGGPTDAADWYTTVMKVEAWQRFVDRATLDGLIRQAGVPLPFAPMGGSADWALIEALKTVRTGEITPMMRFSLGYPLVWVTPRQTFEDFIRGHADPAGGARDRLGLVHQASNDHLVALHIPAHAVDAAGSNRPTFADAGGHRRFLVCSGPTPAPYARCWGQTLDLEQFEEHDVIAPGAAERVCGRIEFKHLVGAKLPFEYIGKLRTERGVHRATDAHFASRKIGRDRAGFADVVDRI